MARGSQAKAEITQKLLETFPGSFLYNDGKEIRICWTENNEPLQIKISLTCAKTNVEPEGDFPTATPNTAAAETVQATMPSPVVEPSPEEKKNIETLLQKLNLM